MKTTAYSRFKDFLEDLELGSDGIWSAQLPPSAQKSERKLREDVASEFQGNLLRAISKHHSVPVMDREVDRFLGAMPHAAAVVDVGGCWGWHWRRVGTERPDVCVVIVDFVRSNLQHAKNLLGPLLGNQVALVHADATALPFPDEAFDGYWTVQTFQHIPDFHVPCQEACRVLKREGLFANYSLNSTPFVRLVYTLLGKPYHVSGELEGFFHLSRASDEQRDLISTVFGGVVESRYSECLLHPDLKIRFTGGEGSPFGVLDAYLGRIPLVGRFFARQQSFEVRRRPLAPSLGSHS